MTCKQTRTSGSSATKRFRHHTTVGLVFVLFCWTGLLPGNTGPALATELPAAMEGVLWHIDFTTFKNGVRQELLDRDFRFEKEMKQDDTMQLSLANQRLNITTVGPAFGLMIKKGLNIEGTEWVELEWGVDYYPDRADWGKGKNREAVMVYFFFGEPVEADRFYLPDSPYFIGLFLGQNEALLTPYKGKSYAKTGSYVCLGNPGPGELITSRFNLAEAYKKLYGTNRIPPITGIAIEVDTDSLPDGRSSAFIQRIRLKKAETTS